MKFSIGDLVRLRSGGPTMTVASLRVRAEGSSDELVSVLCTWFNGAARQDAPFNEKVLELACDVTEKGGADPQSSVSARQPLL